MRILRKIILLTVITIPFISLLFSCSPHIGSSSTQPLVIYPAPPDTTRVQFLKKFSTSSDAGKGRSAFLRFILGAPDVIEIGKPYGLAIYNGKLFICETFKHGFDVFDLKKRSFSEFIPTGKGALKVPINCCFDKRGYLYVADSERKQIVIFDEKGNYVTSFGEQEKFKPTDVFVTDGKIWVCNLAGNQINVYDSSYTLVKQFPPADTTGSARLYSPINIFVTDSNVFVTDIGDFRIKIFDKSGVLKDTLGSYGKNLGQFTRPKGIAIDKESNLYVVDAGFENVQIFNKDRKLLMYFGGSYKGPGDMWLPAKIIIDYDNLEYFQKYVDPGFTLKYLIFVTNQYGPDKVNVYGRVTPKTPDQLLKEKQVK